MESEEEMGSQKNESNGDSPNIRPESQASSRDDEAPYSPNGNDPESPMDNAPHSPTENAPVSPDEEPPQSPGSPASPEDSGSDNGAVGSPEQAPQSPAGSEVDRESNKGDENDKEAQNNDQNENSEDEEVVREDAESEDEGRESGAEDGANSTNGDAEMPPTEDNADKTSVASDVGERNEQEQEDDEDDNASVEERASIHSDDDEDNAVENGDQEENADAGEGTSGNQEENAEKNDEEESSNVKDQKKDDERDSDANSEVEELIADIFGESDEDEEFEGFGEEDLAKAKEKSQQKRKTKALSDSEDEQGEGKGEDNEDEDRGKDGENEDKVDGMTNEQTEKQDSSDDEDEGVKNRSGIEVYDFDLMMEKKRAESSTRRRKRDYDTINDSDDLIQDIINQMQTAAEEDRKLNKSRLAATKKLKMLPIVSSQLKKADLKVSFLEQGVLNVMSEWLSPLPDRSLPHLHIRQLLLKLLGEFPSIDQDTLKRSGIGKAVMYLYKHPKEIKENKIKAGRLISEWSRPIFNLRTDFQSISKEEREKRDFEHMPKKLKMRLEQGEENAQDINTALTGDEKSLRPGEKGWVGRARVPMPSTRDYVVRPKWNVETEFSKASKKQLTRLDKHMRNLKEKKKQNKIQRAITISIEGRKMSL